MTVVNFTLRLPYTVGEKTLQPTAQEVGGSQGRSRRFEEEKNIPSPPGFEPRTVQSDPDRYTDCAILRPPPGGTLSKCRLITGAKSNAADRFVFPFHATAVHSVCPWPLASDTSDKYHDHSALPTVHGGLKAGYWNLSGVCKASCNCHYCGLPGITFRHAAAGSAVSHGHWDGRSDSRSKHPRIKQ